MPDPTREAMLTELARIKAQYRPEEDYAYCSHAHPLRRLIAQIERLDRENAALKEALGFYAQNAAWVGDFVDPFKAPVELDAGKRARAALTGEAAK